jgi:paraquat-inducible protein A
MLACKLRNLVAEGIASLWDHQWAVLAGLTAALAIALPLVRFGLLSGVLGALRLGYRSLWLGPAFRWVVWLDPWSMTDVFLLASFVGFYRLINLSRQLLQAPTHSTRRDLPQPPSH